MNARVLSPADDAWPEALSEMGEEAVPERLFVAGRDLPDMQGAIAIVGTRRPSLAGIEATREFSTGLTQAGFAIVSGLAIGIDAVAHQACLDAGGHTVAVLGCSLDVDYPKRNAALRARIDTCGTVVSEHPPTTQPHPGHFPARNRIIAGLACGVVVIEGGIASGALITARRALGANRAVWALPGSIRNPMAAGPHALIRAGEAALVTEVAHILGDVLPTTLWAEASARPRRARIELNDDEATLLGLLDDTPASPERLRSAAGLNPGAFALAASRLELRGLITRTFGGYRITPTGARAR